MRLPFPIVTVAGRVQRVEPQARNGETEPWAIQVSILTEPNGAVLRVNAHLDDGFTADDLKALAGTDVALPVALTARAGTGTASGRAFLNGRLAGLPVLA